MRSDSSSAGEATLCCDRTGQRAGLPLVRRPPECSIHGRFRPPAGVQVIALWPTIKGGLGVRVKQERVSPLTLTCLGHLPPLSRHRDAAIEWDADTPPGTDIEILTQTGVDFTYTIAPLGSTAGDTGFDRVLSKIPPEAGEAEVTSVRVGSRTFDGVTAELSLDSLLISLPPAAVRRDSVKISFRTRVFQNPTVFDVFVLNSRQPEEIQGVVPVEPGPIWSSFPRYSRAPPSSSTSPTTGS